MIRNKQHGENRRHTGATRLMQITLAAAWRARARTGYSQYSECAGGETVVTGQCVPLGAPTHTTYQRAVKTAALHAFHTGAQGAGKETVQKRKHAQTGSAGLSWASRGSTGRERPLSRIRGEDAEISACYRSARDRPWSGGDCYWPWAAGDGTWSMWMRAPQSQPGRKGAAAARRARNVP